MAEPETKRARANGDDRVVLAYAGEEGSLSHIAATQFCEGHPATQLVGVTNFSKVFDEVVSGRALYGVIPMENSASGTLRSTYDLLVRRDVIIGGELGVRENYCLATRSGVALIDVVRVLSHPMILEACSMFLETRLPCCRPGAPEADKVATISTTEGARRVAEEEDCALSAAIATREASKRHGLTVLAEDIGNDAFLETRYVLIHRRDALSRSPPFPIDAVNTIKKRSACFALRHEPSSIFKLVSCWALRGINLLKFETRPISHQHRASTGLPAAARMWEYLFYADFEVPPSQTDEEMERLWAALCEFSIWQQDFGTYPSRVTRAPKKAPSWGEMVDLMAK